MIFPLVWSCMSCVSQLKCLMWTALLNLAQFSAWTLPGLINFDVVWCTIKDYSLSSLTYNSKSWDYHQSMAECTCTVRSGSWIQCIYHYFVIHVRVTVYYKEGWIIKTMIVFFLCRGLFFDCELGNLLKVPAVCVTLMLPLCWLILLTTLSSHLLRANS